MQFLIDQLFPSKSSSYKSVEATTKEIAEHYDRGNGFFNAFLGEMMVRATPRSRTRHAPHAHTRTRTHACAQMCMCSPPRGPALAPSAARGPQLCRACPPLAVPGACPVARAEAPSWC